MNKKFLSIIALILVMCFALVGCGETVQPPEHTHTFESGDNWEKNAQGHWHKAICAHSDLIADFDDHNDANDDGVCDDCGYSDPNHKHTYGSAWYFNAEKHWNKADCQHSGVIGNEAPHTPDVLGVCTVCGAKISDIEVDSVEDAIELGETMKDNVASGTLVELDGEKVSNYEFRDDYLFIAQEYVDVLKFIYFMPTENGVLGLEETGYGVDPIVAIEANLWGPEVGTDFMGGLDNGIYGAEYLIKYLYEDFATINANDDFTESVENGVYKYSFGYHNGFAFYVVEVEFTLNAEKFFVETVKVTSNEYSIDSIEEKMDEEEKGLGIYTLKNGATAVMTYTVTFKQYDSQIENPYNPDELLMKDYDLADKNDKVVENNTIHIERGETYDFKFVNCTPATPNFRFNSITFSGDGVNDYADANSLAATYIPGDNFFTISTTFAPVGSEFKLTIDVNGYTKEYTVIVDASIPTEIFAGTIENDGGVDVLGVTDYVEITEGDSVSIAARSDKRVTDFVITIDPSVELPEDAKFYTMVNLLFYDVDENGYDYVSEFYTYVASALNLSFLPVGEYTVTFTAIGKDGAELTKAITVKVNEKVNNELTLSGVYNIVDFYTGAKTGYTYTIDEATSTVIFNDGVSEIVYSYTINEDNVLVFTLDGSPVFTLLASISLDDDGNIYDAYCAPGNGTRYTLELVGGEDPDGPTNPDDMITGTLTVTEVNVFLEIAGTYTYTIDANNVVTIYKDGVETEIIGFMWNDMDGCFVFTSNNMGINMSVGMASFVNSDLEAVTELSGTVVLRQGPSILVEFTFTEGGSITPDEPETPEVPEDDPIKNSMEGNYDISFFSFAIYKDFDGYYCFDAMDNRTWSSCYYYFDIVEAGKDMWYIVLTPIDTDDFDLVNANIVIEKNSFTGWRLTVNGMEQNGNPVQDSLENTYFYENYELAFTTHWETGDYVLDVMLNDGEYTTFSYTYTITENGDGTYTITVTPVEEDGANLANAVIIATYTEYKTWVITIDGTNQFGNPVQDSMIGESYTEENFTADFSQDNDDKTLYTFLAYDDAWEHFVVYYYTYTEDAGVFTLYITGTQDDAPDAFGLVGETFTATYADGEWTYVLNATPGLPETPEIPDDMITGTLTITEITTELGISGEYTYTIDADNVVTLYMDGYIVEDFTFFFDPYIGEFMFQPMSAAIGQQLGAANLLTAEGYFVTALEGNLVLAVGRQIVVEFTFTPDGEGSDPETPEADPDAAIKESFVGEYSFGTYIVSFYQSYMDGTFEINVYDLDWTFDDYYTYTVTDNGNGTYTLVLTAKENDTLGLAGKTVVMIYNEYVNWLITIDGTQNECDPVMDSFLDSYAQFPVEGAAAEITSLYFDEGELTAIFVYNEDYSVIRYYLCTITVNPDNTVSIVVTAVLTMDEETFEYVEADDVYGFANATFTAKFDNGEWTVTLDGASTPEDEVYTDFTENQKAAFENYFGFVIPFIENTNYGVSDRMSDYGLVHFFVWNLTEADFNAYREMYSDYQYLDSFIDEQNYTWYVYHLNGVNVEMSYRYDMDANGTEGYVIDVYVYYPTFYDFTPEEKEIFNKYFGFEIPFVPNKDYHVVDCMEDGYVWFYVWGLPVGNFDEYREMFTDYTFVDSMTDDYGITWYLYEREGVYVQMAHYLDVEYNTYLINVYVFFDEAVDEEPELEQYSKLNELQDGDIVIIAADAYKMALSTTKTGFYNVGVSYANGFDVITDAELFIVTVNADGTYTFTSKTGVKIAMAASNASLNNEGTNDTWEIIAKDGADGVFYVKNVVRGNYLEWYTKYSNWSTYKTSSLDDQFEISFLIVERASNGDEDEPEVPADFTAEEKAIYEENFGFVIPFIEGDYYEVEDLMEINGLVRYMVWGITENDFAAYLEMYSEYEFLYELTDTDGITWFLYAFGDVCVQTGIYFDSENDTYVIETSTYIPRISDEAFTDFTDAEKELFMDYFGLVIPFIENISYYVEDYMEDEGYVWFYAWAITEEEYEAYLEMFADYTLAEVKIADDGREIYCFTRDGVCVDVSYLIYEGYGLPVLGVYIYNASNEGVTAGGQADFDTIVTSNANGDSKYTNTYETADGWAITGSAIQAGGTTDMNPQFIVVGPDNTHKAVCMNGKTSAPGKITSPTLEGGISKLTINYTKMFTDTVLDFTITITAADGTVLTHTVHKEADKNDKYTVWTDEWVLETAITGEFTIEIVNNCPSGVDSNKDRVTILEIIWE